MIQDIAPHTWDITYKEAAKEFLKSRRKEKKE